MERFWNKVIKTKKCWKWKGYIAPDGYAKFWLLGANIPAHRVSYLLCIGRIKKNKQLDHLCRNRSCVNPYHLEQVSAKENVLRGTGLTAKNKKKINCPKCKAKFSVDSRGHRYCKPCRRNHYKVNRKRYIKLAKIRYQNNKELIKRKRMEYYYKNKDKILLKQKIKRQK